MPRGKKPAKSDQIACAICKQVVTLEDYAAHVASAHAPAAVAIATAPTLTTAPTGSTVQQYLGGSGVQAPPNVPITPPPPPAPRNPFISMAVLVSCGGQIKAQITSHRSSSGVRSASRPDIPDRGGWILDLLLEKPLAGYVRGPNNTQQSMLTDRFSCRVNIGDIRHQRLWAKFGTNWDGQTVLIRLPRPEDNTRAQWVIE